MAKSKCKLKKELKQSYDSIEEEKIRSYKKTKVIMDLCRRIDKEREKQYFVFITGFIFGMLFVMVFFGFVKYFGG